LETRNKYLPFIFLFIVVFISRLPFVDAGYGVEEDSWGIALAAFHTKLTGIYEPSRFPGHPVQELLYSALWGSGPELFNTLSAFFSAVAALFFALILQHLNFRHFILAAFAFAFVPVVFISSTYTIDFMWSEACVLVSFYLVLRKKLLLAGVVLGLAIGCRITSGVMLLPFMLVIWERSSWKNNLRNLIRISLPMAVVSVLAFLPAILQFGTSFFMYYDQFPYPPVTKVLYKMTLGVFGFIGMLAILFFKIIIFLRRKKAQQGILYLFSIDPKIIYASYFIIILFIISYFRLPQKSGYMIPVIPFTLLLFGYYLNSKHFRVLCYSLILSSFCFSINLTDKLRGSEYSSFALTYNVSGQEIFLDPLSGPVFSDYSKRRQKMSYTSEVLARSEKQKDKLVVISGWWYNEIMVTALEKPVNPLVVFEPYIPEDKMKEYISRGYRISFLPEQEIYNDQMFRINSTRRYASAF
jgi:hypothetical protein